MVMTLVNVKRFPTSPSDGEAFAGDSVRHEFSGRKFEELVYGTAALAGAADGGGSGDVRQKPQQECDHNHYGLINFPMYTKWYSS